MVKIRVGGSDVDDDHVFCSSNLQNKLHVHPLFRRQAEYSHVMEKSVVVLQSQPFSLELPQNSECAFLPASRFTGFCVFCKVTLSTAFIGFYNVALYNMAFSTFSVTRLYH